MYSIYHVKHALSYDSPILICTEFFNLNFYVKPLVNPKKSLFCSFVEKIAENNAVKRWGIITNFGVCTNAYLFQMTVP